MIWIVYLTTNKINNKIYIGVHKTASLDFDGYIGCGVDIYDSNSYKNPKTHFQYAVKKYGTEAFTRTILRSFDNDLDALDLEAWLVNREFVQRPDTYNMELGGGKISKPLHSVKTYLYDMNGEFIISFESRSDAARYIYNSSRMAGNISRAIKTGGFCKNYQVTDIELPFTKNYQIFKNTRYSKMYDTINEKYSTTNNPVNQFTRAKQVAQYDSDGNLVKVWESQTQCCKTGKFTNVQAVLEGKRSQCKGYTFKWFE